MTGPTQERIAVLEEVRALVDETIALYPLPIARVALGSLRDDIDALIESAALAWRQTR
jgi:hypothetical protein